ncbi:hypothetical protein UFOVP118_45 [uncultured Caudovirales phage]|uniref:Uncharacterized protein n=1 Tax=uncultured Caudovirales phage TaxID=2100421 RepID=A0A6J5L5Z7_9CAUD|nr:hypothetical protein UFOVP118_45 [uncultured Caudovirales phage]
MKIEYINNTFDVPDSMIKEYVEGYSDLRQLELREELEVLRHCVYQLLILVEKEPMLLHKDSIKEDFINTLAMKEALFQLKLLHDA